MADDRVADIRAIRQQIKGRYDGGGRAAFVVLCDTEPDGSVTISSAYSGTGSVLMTGAVQVLGEALAAIAEADPDCGSVDDLLREVKRELTRVVREEYRARRNRPEVKMVEVSGDEADRR